VVKYPAFLLLAGAVFALPADAGPGQDLLLEAQIEPAQVYVQAQAIYRLRFYQAVDVRDLRIDGPSARLADIRPIGQGRIYQEVRGNRRYRVHERSYAVLPFASGPLELAGAHAAGRVATPGAQSSGGRHAVSVEASPRIMNVLPAPETAKASWLPARRLTLTESWMAPDPARIGAAFKRTIRIEAAGVDAAQLPELQVVAPGIAVYAEPARLKNRFAGELNIGSREQLFNMVPQRTGDIVVPELQLRWWDTATAMPHIASLPSHRLHIAADTVQTLPASAVPQQAGALMYLLIAAGIFCLILLAIYAARPYLHLAWRLYRTCRAEDARGVRDGLLAWSALIWPAAPPLTLVALAQHINDQAARDALMDIDRRLYGGSDPDNCDASRLLRVVAHITRQIGRTAHRPG
jgi:hypothetical protein